MKQLLLPLVIYGVFLTYSLCTLLFAPGGTGTFTQLKEKSQILYNNLDSLKAKNADLLRLLQLLRSDPTTMAIAARSMGLYGKGQQVMQLPGNRWDIALPNAGKVLFLPPDESIDHNSFRIISIIAGILVLLTGLTIQKSKPERG